MTERPAWYRVALACYGGAVSAVTWGVLVPWHLARVASGQAKRAELLARLVLGPSVTRVIDSPMVIHAVSLGELQAARALIGALAVQAPLIPVVLTCGTADALRVAASAQASTPNLADVVPLPWDRAGAMRRWLAGMRPRAVVLVETELWPNLLDACHQAGVPVAIVSGRMSARDARRYRWAQPFFARVLSAVDLACVQDTEMRERFVGAGIDPARVGVSGDLKADARPAPPVAALASSHALVVAGSLRSAEETLMLDAWRTLPGVTGSARLVLVPRHHERAGRLARRAAREGLRVVAWAEARTTGLEPGSTTIVDVPGALAGLYASADVAIIGGSFARTGAHNVYEAARGGAAMIIGPEAGAMRVPIDELEAGGALTRVREASATALGTTMARLLSNAERRAACASRAHAWLANRSGAAARTAADLLRHRLLEPPGRSEATCTASAARGLRPRWP